MDIKGILKQKHLSVLTSFLIFTLLVSAPLSASRVAETGAQTGSTGTEAAAVSEEPFRYQHDPMENPDAAADIIVNPDAVYGYSPSPDSPRLSKFIDALDWTDKDQVAAGRKEREEYHESFSELYRMIEDMLGEGKNVEEIARAVSKKRNEIRLASYDGDEEGLAIVKKSNLDTYGHEEGPTPDQLYEKYGSWQAVIEGALSSNPGMDACLGLYDEYYDTYDIADRFSKAATSDEETASSQEDASGQNSAGSDSSRTYTVKRGDCLWNIAASELGDGSRWPEIYELNRDKIKNPRLIYADQELVLPAA